MTTKRDSIRARSIRKMYRNNERTLGISHTTIPSKGYANINSSLNSQAIWDRNHAEYLDALETFREDVGRQKIARQIKLMTQIKDNIDKNKWMEGK